MNGISDKLPDYADILENFPVVGIDNINLARHENIIDEVSFSGDRKHYCVCTIDIMNSTKIVSKLTDAQISRYYSLFLNTMATIIHEFNGSIIKNVGDCLLYYFQDTSDITNSNSFKNALDCCFAMIDAHKRVNAILREERLPPLNYRISSDYGKVEIVKAKTSQYDDLFGSVMNLCVKINHFAPPNGMVVGNNLYNIIKSLPYYDFEEKGKYNINLVEYSVYLINKRLY